MWKWKIYRPSPACSKPFIHYFEHSFSCSSRIWKSFKTIGAELISEIRLTIWLKESKQINESTNDLPFCRSTVLSSPRKDFPICMSSSPMRIMHHAAYVFTDKPMYIVQGAQSSMTVLKNLRLDYMHFFYNNSGRTGWIRHPISTQIIIFGLETLDRSPLYDQMYAQSIIHLIFIRTKAHSAFSQSMSFTNQRKKRKNLLRTSRRSAIFEYFSEWQRMCSDSEHWTPCMFAHEPGT